jgi:hypothetical protein
MDAEVKSGKTFTVDQRLDSPGARRLRSLWRRLVWRPQRFVDPSRERDRQGKGIHARLFWPPTPLFPYTDFYTATPDKNGEIWGGLDAAERANVKGDETDIVQTSRPSRRTLARVRPRSMSEPSRRTVQVRRATAAATRIIGCRR